MFKKYFVALKPGNNLLLVYEIMTAANINVRIRRCFGWANCPVVHLSRQTKILELMCYRSKNGQPAFLPYRRSVVGTKSIVSSCSSADAPVTRGIAAARRPAFFLLQTV